MVALRTSNLGRFFAQHTQAAVVTTVGALAALTLMGASAAPAMAATTVPAPSQVSETVTVLRPDGTTAATNTESVLTNPTAYTGETLQYVVTYTLTGSVNIQSAVLTDANAVLTDGYGTLVGTPTVTGVDSSALTTGTGTTSFILTIASHTAGNQDGVADGTYTLTYQVKLNNTIPAGTTQVVTGSNNPAGEAGGVADVTDNLTVSATDLAGNSVTDKAATAAASVDLLPTPALSYKVDTSADKTTVTAGNNVNLTTTVSNTGNLPLGGSYAGNTDLSIPASSADAIVNVAVPSGITYNNDASGTGVKVAATPASGATATLTFPTVAPGASSAANFTESVPSSTAAGDYTTTGTPNASGATGTHGTDATFTVSALNPTDAILRAVHNNGGYVIAVGAALIGTVFFLVFFGRRKKNEQEAK